MKAKIYITYKDGILDPQGKTVGGALNSMGLSKIENVMITPIDSIYYIIIKEKKT